MSGKRQKIQYSLALEPVDQGETPISGYQGTEPFVAKPTSESPAPAEQLMEEVCDRENLVRAWKRAEDHAVYPCEPRSLPRQPWPIAPPSSAGGREPGRIGRSLFVLRRARLRRQCRFC